MALPLRRAGRETVLAAAAALIVVIALSDWRIAENIPLGFLYLVPMMLVGRVLRPWQTLLVAGVCTMLSEFFDPFHWDIRTGTPRDVLYFAAFATVGIFVYETHRTQQVILAQMHEIERQSIARQEAEQDLRILIESTPAAILTANEAGLILMANQAAHRVLSAPAGTLPGRLVQHFVPALANIQRGESFKGLFRAMMQAHGQRLDGESFIAEICFSTYETESGARLAALILDTSEEMRSREESSLHQMLAGSRIAIGAVSHEIRNVCGAIGVVYQNLQRSATRMRNKDFEALGNLVVALQKIAAVDLRQDADEGAEVDLQSILDDLKIVITPSLHDESIACTWSIEPDLPRVWAERTNLMQIFLNLTNNSIRALQQAPMAAKPEEPGRQLSIAARGNGAGVTVEVIDNGGGVAQPENLFRPFQPGAHSIGLGLYLSRAFARSFGGELRYKPLKGCACFIVELPAAEPAGADLPRSIEGETLHAEAS